VYPWWKKIHGIYLLGALQEVLDVRLRDEAAVADVHAPEGVEDFIFLHLPPVLQDEGQEFRVGNLSVLQIVHVVEHFSLFRFPDRPSLEKYAAEFLVRDRSSRRQST